MLDDQQEERPNVASSTLSEHVTDKQRARYLLDAIRTLKAVETDGRAATADERATMQRFGGFGALALSIFPDPVTQAFKLGWEGIGRELAELLTKREYDSAKRSTFNAFYTAPLVMGAVYAALRHFGVPDDEQVLEPGCGAGGFMAAAPDGMRFTGVELDDLSGRIARAVHPQHDVRIESFRDTRPPAGGFDAVVGNVPFGDITLRHNGRPFSLHDYFFAKSVDSLAPGGVLGLVTSRYTLDKIGGTARDYMAERADFLGAIRLPDDAFKEQGTRVVMDIIFLRKRHPGEPEAHAGEWRDLDFLDVDSRDGARPLPVNAWYAAHPELILGEASVEPGMHGGDTLRVRMQLGYPERLQAAVASLPASVYSAACSGAADLSPGVGNMVEIPHGMGEGSFFVSPSGALFQVECGKALPVMHGARSLAVNAGGTMGPRLGGLIGLRDAARAVLRSQNEECPTARGLPPARP